MMASYLCTLLPHREFLSLARSYFRGAILPLGSQGSEAESVDNTTGWGTQMGNSMTRSMRGYGPQEDPGAAQADQLRPRRTVSIGKRIGTLSPPISEDISVQLPQCRSHLCDIPCCQMHFNQDAISSGFLWHHFPRFPPASSCQHRIAST